MKRTVRFTLNNRKFGSQTTVEGVHVGDDNSCELIITVTDGNKILDLSSETTVATMCGTKPDGTTISRPCSIVDNNIVYTLEKQDTAVSGNVFYQVTVISDDGISQSIIATARFTVAVMKNIYIPIYRLLESEPSDWSTNYRVYYRLLNNKYTAISDSSCPAFLKDTFYYLVNPNYDSKDDYGAFQSALVRVENLIGRASDILTILDKKINDNEAEHICNKVSAVDFRNLSATDYPNIKALNNYHTNYVEPCYDDINNLEDSKADKATTLEGYGITDGLANGDGTVKLANLAQDILDYIVAHSNGEGGGVTLTQVQTLLADYAKSSELDNKEDISNRVTSFTQAFTDESGIKYPTVLALLKYLEDYYYDFDEVNDELANKLDNTAGSVTTDNIASKAVTNEKIANGAITALKLASNAVSGSNIAQNQISTNHLENGAVTADKLADGSITTEKIAEDLLKLILSGSGSSGGATVNGDSVPDYWVEELEAKADAIQTAMEKAGRNKSAFLWYTDAHWANGNSKVSPSLLNYLYMNTPMNKVNFGGDIIGNSLLATREEMKYLYEWRKAIKNLPNHHSVLGNHDMFSSDSVDYEDDNYRYTMLIAPEESSDMVMGNGNYYYIDNHSEKTRYLYLCYPNTVQADLMAQGEFIVNALKTTPENWHIVVISHRWFQYSSSSTPTTGVVSAFEKDILSVFDAYNARVTRSGSNYFYAQDFTDAKAKVEFCIGGHIHVDYDFTSDGGIPVIITTADANQNRVPDSTVDSGTIGTTTEAAVYGIIADYNDAENIKITVVGVGRGTSRVVRNSNVKIESISNITYSGDTTVGMELDITKFSFTANYSNGSSEVVTGATSVNPTTVEVVGDNTVTITYTEGVVTVSGTITIVGTDIPVVNLFDKNDSDIALTGRFNSSNAVVNYAEGQLVTGYIEGKVGDVFTLVSDKANNTNGYTGTMMMYDSNKNPIANMSYKSTANNTVVSSDDYKTVVFNVVSSYPGKDWDASNTAFVRFCVAYTDIDSITITKS